MVTWGWDVRAGQVEFCLKEILQSQPDPFHLVMTVKLRLWLDEDLPPSLHLFPGPYREM